MGAAQGWDEGGSRAALRSGAGKDLFRSSPTVPGLWYDELILPCGMLSPGVRVQICLFLLGHRSRWMKGSFYSTLTLPYPITSGMPYFTLGSHSKVLGLAILGDSL